MNKRLFALVSLIAAGLIGAHCASGTGCTAYELEGGGKALICEDGNYVEWADGAPGSSCSVTENEDGTVLLSCEDGTSATISDGAPCRATQREDGPYVLECADGSWLPYDQTIDVDGDGYSPGQGDCDEARDDIFPGQTEVCDDVDNDCDGLTDGEDPGLDWTTGVQAYPDEDLDGAGAKVRPPGPALSVRVSPPPVRIATMATRWSIRGSPRSATTSMTTVMG